MSDREREIKKAILELMADGQMYAPMLIRSRLLTKKMVNVKEIDFFRIMFSMEETGEVKYWTAEVTEAGKKETAHFYQITEESNERQNEQEQG